MKYLNKLFYIHVVTRIHFKYFMQLFIYLLFFVIFLIKMLVSKK